MISIFFFIQYVRIKKEKEGTRMCVVHSCKFVCVILFIIIISWSVKDSKPLDALMYDY